MKTISSDLSNTTKEGLKNLRESVEDILKINQYLEYFRLKEHAFSEVSELDPTKHKKLFDMIKSRTTICNDENESQFIENVRNLANYLEDDRISHHQVKLTNIQSFAKELDTFTNSPKKVTIDDISTSNGVDSYIVSRLLTSPNIDDDLKKTINKMVKLNIEESRIVYQCTVYGLLNDNKETQKEITAMFDEYIDRKEAMLEQLQSLQNIPNEIRTLTEQYLQVTSDDYATTAETMRKLIKCGIELFKKQEKANSNETPQVLEDFSELSKTLKRDGTRALFSAIEGKLDHDSIAQYVDSIKDFASNLKESLANFDERQYNKDRESCSLSFA